MPDPKRTDPKRYKTIVTTNPKDPRLKAYSDSLSKYNRDRKNYSGETGLSYDRLLANSKKEKVTYTEKGTAIHLNKKPTTPVVYKKTVPKETPMPDKKPIMLDEVVVTATRTSPKKYREATEKVKLYPKGEVIDKFKIDSLKRAGHDLGKPIQIKGQADMYGADQSDRIKKLLRK